MTFEKTSATRPLVAVGLAMIPLFVLFAVGVAVDPRIVTGAPVWLKPAKFAISICIYCLTLAWLIGFVSQTSQRLRQLVLTTAIALVIEMIIIGVQAGRGTTSHFNNRTPLDSALFGIMGIAILILLLASIGITIVLFRQKFDNAAWGWALRLGMAITVLGSASGGLMLAPKGAHTVGAADGGPGLPGTSWSTEHGDLRVPHFMGLHAVQIIPFLAWLAWRKNRLRSRTVFVTAGSYLALFMILTVQALHGQPVVAPDSTTGTALSVWLVATAVALAITTKEEGYESREPFLSK